MVTSTAPFTSPIWRKAAADSWIGIADTAKAIRSTLAMKFPGVKFYVRSKTYAGGGSIDIYYDGVVLNDAGNPVRVLVDYDGNVLDPTPVSDADYGWGRFGHLPKPGMPSKAAVNAVVGAYAGRGFDGMIDMGYSKSSWINPDGTAAYGHSDGTLGSHGSDPGYDHPRPTSGAVKVHFGASYVFVNDDLPYDVRVRVGR